MVWCGVVGGWGCEVAAPGKSWKEGLLVRLRKKEKEKKKKKEKGGKRKLLSRLRKITQPA